MEAIKRYRFEPITQPPSGDQIDLVGLNSDSGLCITDYQQGKFYPSVSHYLVEDTAPFDRYAEAACNETIESLESQLGQIQNQTLQLRDLFAVAALVGEFVSDRGISVEQAVKFSYSVADKMLVARESGNE